MTAKTIEYIVHVLVTTVKGEQPPEAFMLRTYGLNESKIKDISSNIKTHLENLHTEII